MTYAELEKKLTKLLEQPDSALANVKPLLDEIKADYDTMITLQESNIAQDKRIRDLQDTNMKLFLAQTKSVEEDKSDEDDELDGMDAVDAFVAELNKEE